MVKIVADQIDVKAVFKKAFITLTKQICNVELQEADVFAMPGNGRTITATIQSRGAFCAAITCIQDKKLAQAILLGMTKGRTIPVPEQELYIKEYFNIICGNGISRINNKIKSASRPGIPVLFEEIKEPEASAGPEEVIILRSDYGDMAVYVNYKWST